MNEILVTVGNIGTVYVGYDEMEAKQTYTEYVEQSRSGYGRAAYEDVCLWIDNEPVEMYIAEKPPSNGILSQFI